MPAIWMYQHPSNMNTWKEYDSHIAQQIEDGYQEYAQRGTPELLDVELHNDVVVVISFKLPMKQYSPKNEITRRIRRFVENAGQL